MDDAKKKSGAQEVLRNEVFLHFYNEACDAQKKVLEFGDPSNPEPILDANKALRTLRLLMRKLEKAANQGESE